MTTDEVVKHFGNSKSAVAAALNISPSAVSQWGEQPPEKQQFRLEKITRGALKADVVHLPMAS